MINILLSKYKRTAGIIMTILGCMMIPFDTAGASLLFIGLGLAIFFCKGDPYDISDCFPDEENDEKGSETETGMYKHIG